MDFSFKFWKDFLCKFEGNFSILILKGFLLKNRGQHISKGFCHEIDVFMTFFFIPKRNLKGSMKFWAFWSTNSGWVGGFVTQETKNLKSCDLDLNKWGGYIKGGIYDEYNDIPPCGAIVLEGNFSFPGCSCLWCSTLFSGSVINSSF